ncbi:hypothetical protein AJ87_08270 [Rhizobium yanglingense]|nr:hypothetical protein AJ87_08270 [Rhizobium yanglingense]
MPFHLGDDRERPASVFSQPASLSAKGSSLLGRSGSEDYAVIGGERTKLQVAHIKLSHSRAFLVRAYLLQTRTRCCLTLTGTGSACSAACLVAASPITCPGT